MPTVAVHTLGCKLNYAESSSITGQFRERGYEVVEFGNNSDVVVINTCSVTERADRECRQIVRRVLRSSPHPFVVVTGCYAQLAPEELSAIPGVDLILGAAEKFELFDHLGGIEKKLYPHVLVSDIGAVQSFGVGATRAEGRTRAYLKIQDGCDYHCSFCTIPLARGGSRSQGIADTVRQAKTLVNEGFKEITLTGVNVGDYRHEKKGGLLTLLTELVSLQGLERIRISSIEPNLLTDEIIQFVADHEVMCKHFHIPLQSGCNEILRAMRRRYSTTQYREVIQRILEAIPECGIGADVIVGFPGESDTHFTTTCNFLAELPLTYIHAFTYSERPNTPAAVYANQVEPRIRFKRNSVLRTLGEKKRRACQSAMVGTTVRVLFEGIEKDGLRYGYTSNYVRVGAPVGSAGENEMVDVHITGVKSNVCLGECCGGTGV
jgi:threonylcarbamoyladenosine tRNA methylthiotransferase MtaB